MRTSIPDVSVSDMENPERAALVLAFRAEVAREIRPPEFHDKSGLIQRPSTGVPAELARLSQRDRRPDGHQAGGPVLRPTPRPAVLAGREELLACRQVEPLNPQMRLDLGDAAELARSRSREPELTAPDSCVISGCLPGRAAG